MGAFLIVESKTLFERHALIALFKDALIESGAIVGRLDKIASFLL
jgi:hypothetical protein